MFSFIAIIEIGIYNLLGEIISDSKSRPILDIAIFFERLYIVEPNIIPLSTLE